MFDDELPGPDRVSRALRITLEGGVREDKYRDEFPDARVHEMELVFEFCENACQAAGDMGIAIAEKRMRQKDFEPRMTQRYPFLTDDDITLLYDAAMRAAK